jgi:hypothetical protein
MARQCSRGPNSCKSRVGADVTPALHQRARTSPQQHGTETTALVLQAAPHQVGLRGRVRRRRGREFAGDHQIVRGDSPVDPDRRRFARRGREGRNCADRSIDLLTAVQDRLVATAEEAGDGRSRAAAMAATPSPRESPDG